MTTRAPRPPYLRWRGACLAAALAATAALADEAGIPAEVVSATYAEPTARYPHGALGDPEEWGALEITWNTCFGCAGLRLQTVTLRLPETRVFEDVAPRLIELNEVYDRGVLVVESDARLGARLAIYGPQGLRAATDFIGQPNRWLAPLGAGDFDGDGRVEISYVDRPHLARVLRVVEFDGSAVLREEASAEGHTNHRFGEPVISGGVLDCGQGPEMLTADPDWTRVQGTRLVEGRLVTRDLGAYRGALECPS